MTRPIDLALVPIGHGLSAGAITVTPELAQQWLGDNWKHRPIDPKRAAKFAARLEAGEWRLNGKTIVFDPNGRLLGGQHRLTACAETGVPFTTVVVWGVQPEAVLGDDKREAA